MQDSRFRRTVATFAAAALILAACSGGGDSNEETAPSTTGPGGATNTPVVNTPEPSSTTGPSAAGSSDAALGFRLSEGSATAPEVEPVALATGTPLTDTEIAAVLARLPEWDIPATDVAEFNRPPDSLTPPLVGDTVGAPFPPAPVGPPAPDATADGPLEVVRMQPEGDVDVAPFLSVTFNEPMVPLATLDQLDVADVPITMTPTLDGDDAGIEGGVEGRWRWIGTRTLRFEVIPGTIDRLPAATTYTIEIPAGTTSENGAVLADTVTWTFSTPPPTVTNLTGLNDSMGLDPVFVATFDQRVDARGVLDAISFGAGNVNDVRLATAAEIDGDEIARQNLDQQLPDRAVAFVPTATLVPDTSVRITIGEGVASLEGPRPGEATFTESGSTYGPLRLSSSRCSADRLVPQESFSFDFSNALDVDAFEPTFIRVEPAVPGLRAEVFGRSIFVSGATSGNTDYTVTFAGELTDTFGQQLGEKLEVTCRVGPARPFLTGPDRQFVTTDPFAETPGLAYTSVNHEELRVVAWQVRPDQYAAYLRHLDEYFSDTRPADPDWPVVMDTVVSVDGETDAVTETIVDLSAAFAASGGPIVVRVETIPEIEPRSENYWENRPILTWVQTTTLGVDAFVGDSELLIWTTDLLTGTPVGQVSVQLLGVNQTVTTDGDGLARVDLSGSSITGLAATSGDQSAMLPARWFDGWRENERSSESRWYVIDDRGIYRPGETARFTGFVREVTAEDAQLALFAGDAHVEYNAFDAQGNEIATGTTPVNALGGFNISVDIPEASNTGFAFIDLRLGGVPLSGFFATGHQFQIQDFRTPEFEVTTRAETPAPYYVVSPATVAVDAEYFAGGPLPDAEVNWLVSTTDTTYRPPNWDDFNFGVWTPWWYGGRSFSAEDVAFESDVFFESPCFDCGPSFGADVQQFTGTTDSAGSHYLQIDFTGGESLDQPTSVVTEATVFDVNRQALSSRTTLLVHPAQYYVGLRSDRSFVEQGQPIVIDTTVVDVDGAAVPSRDVDVTAGRIDYGYVDGRYVEELVDPQTCTITSTSNVSNDAPDGSMRCEFSSAIGGQYEITAIVTDDDGRQNRAVYTQWVSGGTARPTRSIEQGEVTVVPNADTFAPGDTAELLVQAPFAPAHGIVTVVRAGVESVEVFDAADGSAVLRIPITDDDIPNLRVRVDMVGASERVADNGAPLPDAPQQPAFATGEINLPIPPVSRTLDVVATPASEAVAPGASTSVTVSVTDADGQPAAGANVTLIVVDEAVLSLSGYSLLDPLSVFYQDTFSQLNPELMRQSIILANPEIFDVVNRDGDATANTEAPAEFAESEADFAAAEPAADDSAGGASRSGSAGEAGAEIDVRTDFDALAVFAPDETTGADGTVTVEVDMPDSATRYRIMAVSVDGADRFGSGESTITARLPITVRPSAPRFLNFGDRFELPIVVQNQTDADVEVDVAIETANLILTGVAGKRVTVPANNRVEVRFDAAADEVGTARFRVATVAGEFADAAEIDLPVYTPATAEAFATYGVIDDANPIGQPLLAPDGVFPQFGGLEISTSSTALQALTDAVLYLYEYRYDSADGYASRIMAVAALRDVLDAFDADGLPDAAALNDRVASDIDRLQALQNFDGGFPYWQRGRESIPWVSVQSVHALVLARDNGYRVDENVLAFAFEHLRNIENYIPQLYSQATKDAISAYALYVRDLSGDADPAKAQELYDRASDTMQIDSIAQLWPVIEDASTRTAIERLIDNAAVETPAAATFATSYGEDSYLIAHSDRRTDGIILGTLVSETPDSDLIPKVVTGLLGNQTRGRWNNAHENAFILLALNEYFDTFESVDPDFIARAWLGDTYAAESEFRGRSTDTFVTTVPMADLIAETTGSDLTNLVIVKDGAGRLYYRLGLRYAPDDLQLDPRDEGFVVERIYEGVDDPNDVTRDADGSWRIKAGATVRVSLTMVADARRTHVALIDPLPAGLEALNPAFATSQTIPPADDSARSGYWWWNWYEHQNLRDDRVEAYTSYLPGGTYEYTYIARATTPGEFVAPPTRAEEIYAPEVFGRGSSDRVIVTG